MNWAYGITTVPSRYDSTLPITLKSLAAGGFNEPWLFIDNCSNPSAYEAFGLPMSNRRRQLNVFGNWILGLWELYICHPTANRFAMFQDDIQACTNLRQYLERCKFPRKGFWNLYNTPENEDRVTECTGWYESTQMGRGALGLVFDRDAVQSLLGSPTIAAKPLRAGKNKWLSVDGAISRSFVASGYTEYVHRPSLVQHIGQISTIRHNLIPVAQTFPGENFDALTLLEATDAT